MNSNGLPLDSWQPVPRPGPSELAGRYASLERLDARRHAAELHAAFAGHDQLWDYMAYGPFATEADYRGWAAGMAARDDPFFYAIRDREGGQALGVASFLRIEPAHGVIEVGHICLAPALQRRRAATEAMFLMMRWAFEAGYRRYEWKCNAANSGSRRAAERLGLSFEGVFRQHMVVKGRNRDTAWFAAIDREWPALSAAFSRWLDPANFDADGRQRLALSSLTAPLLATVDPGRR